MGVFNLNALSLLNFAINTVVDVIFWTALILMMPWICIALYIYLIIQYPKQFWLCFTQAPGLLWENRSDTMVELLFVVLGVMILFAIVGVIARAINKHYDRKYSTV